MIGGDPTNRITGSVSGPVVQAGHVDTVHIGDTTGFGSGGVRVDGRWFAVVSGSLALVTASSVWLSVYRAAGFDPTGVAGVVGGLVVVGAVVAVLLVVVLGFRSSNRPPRVGVDEARSRLAAAVREQWRGEWVERDLMRSPALPVTWLTDDGRRSTEEVSAAFRSSARRRLVVLGPGGSGKTVLAVRLTLDLLDHRLPNDPVPVPLSLARWDPERQRLRDWLAERLAVDHGVPSAADLVASGAVLPVLDGLDEMAAPRRRLAVEAVNAQWAPTDPFVVTSRPDPAPVELVEADVVEAVGVEPADAVAHLGERWRTAAAHGPVAAALTSPLLVSLARAAPRPADLLALGDEEAVRVFLLESFVREVYSDRPRHAGAARRPRHRGPGPRRWLGFLARHLQRRSTPNLAWWELRRALPRGGLEVGVGVGAGLVWCVGTALLGVRALGLGVGLVAGLLFGVAFCAGYSAVRARTHRTRGAGDGGFRGLPGWSDLVHRLRWGGLAVAAAWALALPLSPGALPAPGAGRVSLGVVGGVSASLLAGLVLGVVAGALLRVADGLDQRVAPARGGTPTATLRRDRVATAVVGVVFAVAVGLVTGGSVWIATGDVGLGAWSAAGGAVTGGPAAIALFTAWPAYVLAWVWLALLGRLPWRLEAFLADAHRLEVLRQFGDLYQFRHLALLQQLAEPAAAGNGQPVR